MRKPFCTMVVILALGGCFALAQQAPKQQDPSQNPQSQQPTAGTADVQSDIQSALQKDPSLAGANVNVQVVGKTVELSGTVPSKDAKETAERIAKDHSGGMTVKNKLKVSGGNPPSK
jgi:osmotically-inducible protein OsmY